MYIANVWYPTSLKKKAHGKVISVFKTRSFTHSAFGSSMISFKMADKPSSSTHEITYYLNVENAKILAFVMVTGFVVYHGFINVKYSKFSAFLFLHAT